MFKENWMRRVVRGAIRGVRGEWRLEEGMWTLCSIERQK